MNKIFPLLLLAALGANGAGQSGRKITRPATQPDPPIQAPVWSQPDIAPPAPRSEAREELASLPQSFLQRSIKSLDNGSFRFADFKGKVMVVNVWASWCPPCRSEVPEYDKVRKTYVGREVEFVGLTTEDPRTSTGRVREFVRSVNFGFRLGWADRETAFTLMNGINTLPQTLVIASSGRIVNQWRGYSRKQSGVHLREAIEQALSETSPAQSFR